MFLYLQDIFGRVYDIQGEHAFDAMSSNIIVILFRGSFIDSFY